MKKTGLHINNISIRAEAGTFIKYLTKLSILEYPDTFQQMSTFKTNNQLTT